MTDYSKPIITPALLAALTHLQETFNSPTFNPTQDINARSCLSPPRPPPHLFSLDIRRPNFPPPRFQSLDFPSAFRDNPHFNRPRIPNFCRLIKIGFLSLRFPDDDPSRYDCEDGAIYNPRRLKRGNRHVSFTRLRNQRIGTELFKKESRGVTLHLRRNLRRNLTQYYAREDLIPGYSFRSAQEDSLDTGQPELLDAQEFERILDEFCQRQIPIIEEVHEEEMALLVLRTRLRARSKGNWKRYRKAAKLLRLENWPKYGEVDREQLTLDFLKYAESILRRYRIAKMDDFHGIERKLIRSRLTSSFPKGFWDLKRKLYIRRIEDLRPEELQKLELYNSLLEEELANFVPDEEEEEWVPRDDYSDEEEAGYHLERNPPSEAVQNRNFIEQEFGKAKWTTCDWIRRGIPIRYELEWPPPSLQNVSNDEVNARIEEPKPEGVDVQTVAWKITMKKYPFLDGNFIKRSIYVLRSLTVDAESPNFLDSKIPREILLGGLAGGKSYDMDHRLKSKVDLGKWLANETEEEKKGDKDQKTTMEGDLGTKEMDFLMTWKISSKPLPKLLGKKDERSYETVHEHKLDLLRTRRWKLKEKKLKEDPLPEPPKEQPTSDKLKYWTVTPCMDWGGKKHSKAASILHNIKAKAEKTDPTLKVTDRADESTTSADPYPWKLSRPELKDFHSHCRYDTVDGKPLYTKSDWTGPNKENQDQKMGGTFYVVDETCHPYRELRTVQRCDCERCYEVWKRKEPEVNGEPLEGSGGRRVDERQSKEGGKEKILEEPEEEEQQRNGRVSKRITFSKSWLTDIGKAIETDALEPPAGTDRGNPRPTLVDPTHFEFDGWQAPEIPALLRARQIQNSRILGPSISEDSRALPRHNGFDDFDFSTTPSKPSDTEAVIPPESQIIYSKPTIAITSQCSTDLKDKQRDGWLRLLRRLETCSVYPRPLDASHKGSLFPAQLLGSSVTVHVGGKDTEIKDVQLKLEATIVDPNPEPGLWCKEPQGPQKTNTQRCLLLTFWSVILLESKSHRHVETNSKDYSFTDLDALDPSSKELRINKITGASTRLLVHTTYFDPRSKVVVPEFTTPAGLEKWFTQYLDGYKDLGTGIWDPDTWTKPDIEPETFPHELWDTLPTPSTINADPSQSKQSGHSTQVHLTISKSPLRSDVLTALNNLDHSLRSQSPQRINCQFFPLSSALLPEPTEAKTPDNRDNCRPRYHRELIFEPYIFEDLTNPRFAPSGQYLDFTTPEPQPPPAPSEGTGRTEMSEYSDLEETTPSIFDRNERQTEVTECSPIEGTTGVDWRELGGAELHSDDLDDDGTSGASDGEDGSSR